MQPRTMAVHMTCSSDRGVCAQVASLISSIVLSDLHMASLLTKASTNSTEVAACQWLRENEPIWSPWIAAARQAAVQVAIKQHGDAESGSKGLESPLVWMGLLLGTTLLFVLLYCIVRFRRLVKSRDQQLTQTQGQLESLQNTDTQGKESWWIEEAVRTHGRTLDSTVVGQLKITCV